MRSIIAFTNWKISNFQVLRFFVCVLIFLVWFDLVSFRLLCFWKSSFFSASSSLASNYTHRKKKCQDRMIWLVKLHQFFGYKRVQFLSIMVSIGIIWYCCWVIIEIFRWLKFWWLLCAIIGITWHKWSIVIPHYTSMNPLSFQRHMKSLGKLIDLRGAGDSSVDCWGWRMRCQRADNKNKK